MSAQPLPRAAALTRVLGQPENTNLAWVLFPDLETATQPTYACVSTDACPDESLFVYRYLRDHLLSFVQNDVALPVTKRILRDALRGLAALHGKRGIVHTAIKANSILLDWKEQGGDITLERVQVANIEDGVYVPEGYAIKGS
ncbi:hypothetical protein J1614_002606 [Plenodomus biglobosus]|nr:hypothetical protein J1614_002606 [Plenodomus biglobosus]